MIKKLFATLLLALLVSVATQTYGQMAIDKGTKFVNLGLGFGGYSYYSGSGIGLNAGLDIGVYDNITVGGQVGYRSYGASTSSFDLGVRGSYHFNRLLKLTTEKADLYAGLGIAFYSFSRNYTTSYVPVHLGGRYFFTEKLGGFAELGSSLSTLKLGVTFKL